MERLDFNRLHIIFKIFFTVRWDEVCVKVMKRLLFIVIAVIIIALAIPFILNPT
jgi:hypothetical protein